MLSAPSQDLGLTGLLSMKLTHVRITASDLPTLRCFYEAITGIEAAGSDDYCEIRTAGGVVALTSQRAIDLYANHGAESAANRSAIIEFQVEDVDRERARLSSIVKEWVLEPVTQPWGNRSMLFRDPDGNLINFYTPCKISVSDLLRSGETTGARQ